MHRHTRIAAIAAVLVGLGLPASAVASEPTNQITLEDGVTFQSGRWTQACGFPVFMTVQGTIHISLRTDRSGAVHEHDAMEDWSITFSAPSTGRSFAFKFGPSFFDYPDGVYLGAPAVVTFTGIQEQSPGGPSSAGRVILPATVGYISPEGVPYVETSGPNIAEDGHFLDRAEVQALTCAALS